jgi:hypothetical protein
MIMQERRRERSNFEWERSARVGAGIQLRVYTPVSEVRLFIKRKVNGWVRRERRSWFVAHCVRLFRGRKGVI